MDIFLLHVSALHHDDILRHQPIVAKRIKELTPCEVVKLSAIGGVGCLRGSGIPLLKAALALV